MANDSNGEKTEKPTPKRKKDARREGQIARTNDLPAWLSILAFTYLVPHTLRAGMEQGQRMFTGMGDVLAGDEGAMLGFLGDALFRGTLVLAPLVLMAMVIGVLGQVSQIGWAPKKMKPDVKRLNPLKGLKNLFGAKLIWDSVKNLGKLTVIVIMGIGPIREAYTTIFTQDAMSIGAMGSVVADVAISFLRNTAIVGLVIAGADYWQSKKQVDKQTKMSKQDLKQEHKQQEGDPQVKGQIRARQMAMSRNRMMAEVPSADVVLVNPTHIAVALKYDPMSGAPQVLAKGAGAIAARIRDLAAEHEIPVVRDIPLARTVYRVVEVGEHIPVELYEAVARVLAFVYALRRKGRAAGVHTSPFASAHEALADLERPDRRPALTP